MAPNIEQVKSLLRWLITTFGGGIAGFFVAKGWFTIDQVTSVLNSPVLISTVASIIVGIWGLVTHTQTNAVKVVDDIAKNPDSPVKAIITEPTVEGHALASSIASDTTVIASTPKAQEIAK